jgi:phosphoribosylanthranilate isomerase
MSVETKICGVNSAEAVAAAVTGGARYLGFVFYPPSPRAVTTEQAAALAAKVGPGCLKVGLFVDPDDATLAEVLGRVPLDLLQLHGSETPRRVAQIRAAFGVPTMKAIKVARAEDLEPVAGFAGAADRLLFDAKAPKTMKNALPGGNALSFDWRLLAGRRWPLPWMLSGGLKPENIREAVEISGARALDVSSGVEERPGVKSPALIADFLERSRGL